MTSAYAIQWPCVAGILPETPNFMPKWNHTVVNELNFCSEWEASHRATELAMQFGLSTYHPPCQNVTNRKKAVGCLSVRFSSEVDVFIGEDDNIQMFHATVSADVLPYVSKPWSNVHCDSGIQHSFSNFDVVRDLGCSVEKLFSAFLTTNPVISESFACPSLSSDPLSFCKAVLIPVGSSSHVASLDLFTKIFTSDRPLIKSFTHYDCTVDSVDPQFEEAVSIPDSLQEGSAFGSVVLQPRYCPNGDTGDSGSRSDQAAGFSSPAQDPPSHQRAESPIRLPLFAQQMMVNLPREFVSNPVRIVQGLLVRTWYLHHINIPKSLQARQVMLTGPPHLWRAQILVLWDDLLIPGEDITLDLVQPSPPRNWHETSILFDLILAQGLYAGRFSGLVSVSPTITEPSLRMYAIAVSLAPVISGQDIVTEAEVQTFCNRFDCLIFHAQTQLYIDFQPVHHMTHGDSFVIYLSRKPEAPSASNAEILNAADPAPEPDAQPDINMDVEDSQPAATANTPVSPGMTGAHDSAHEERRRVTLYRLDRPPISTWIRWRRFSLLLQDILEMTAICPSDLVAVHPLLVKPVGESLHEFSAILQLQGDIAPGSDESLIVLDTIFHQQGAVSQMFAEPAFDRRVVKIPMHVSRQGLLHFARVANYCEHSRSACVLSVNHQIWNVQNMALWPLLHGTYGRIQIPPSTVHGVETCRAVSLIEDVSDTSAPTFAQVYPKLPHHSNTGSQSQVPSDPVSGTVFNAALTLRSTSQPRHHRFADEHPSDAPEFQVPIPAQAPALTPNVPEWNSFLHELMVQFDEHSVIEIPEEGPVLMVTTWYIHHDHAPLCLVGRLIRLSNRPAEWLQSLIAPWIHMLRPFENVVFRIVRPSPASNVPGLYMVHIILEQGLQQARFTALFSTIFQGLHGDVTHRRAQSIPNALSREVIVRILGISELCQARRCKAWSGRLQFHRHQLDQVFSGIGVCLTVDAFRNRFANVDDEGFPVGTASSSSSQLPPRMSFREDDASLFPSSDMVSDDDCDPLPEHAPSRLIPELTVIWQTYLMSDASRPYRFYVETWYCDHDRFPRTNRGREVLLPPDSNNWRQAIVDKWQDIIDPGAELFMYVVSPPPFGGPPEVLAHVLLAQHQHRGFISALITTLAPGDDPWDPPRVALKLPSVVDKGLLIQESGLFLFCPRFIPFNDCSATSGDQVIFYDVLRPAHSGDSFLCVAEAPAAHLTANALEDSSKDTSNQVSRLFSFLAGVITKTTCAVVKATHTQSLWQHSLESLIHEIDDTCQAVQDLISQASGCSITQESVHAESLPQPSRFMHHRVEPCFQVPGVVLNGVLPTTSVHLQPLIECWQTWKETSGNTTPFLVAVWYIDQLRSPTCCHCRMVELKVPVPQWTTVLLRTWCKEIWPYADAQLFFIRPQPSLSDLGVQAHVLILQQPLPGLKSILLDTFIGSPDKPQTVVKAVTLPANFADLDVAAILDQQIVQSTQCDLSLSIFCGQAPWPSKQGQELDLPYGNSWLDVGFMYWP